MNELDAASEEVAQALKSLSKRPPDVTTAKKLLKAADKNLKKAIKTIGADNTGEGET